MYRFHPQTSALVEVISQNEIGELQKIGKIPEGILEFQKLKAVGTDCVKGNPDDVLIQLD